MTLNIPRIVIGAVSSGSGKTTIVTGMLSALRQQGIVVQSYKVGPDYIDPGYHQLASGHPAHNLDSWLMSENTMAEIFADNAKTCQLAIIEGVMGLYDGGNKGISSTAEIAKLLKAPVLLVIDCKSMGASAAAIALGFKQYDQELRLAGVILNRVGSDNHERMIREAMDALEIPVLGAVRRNNELTMPERHLGLLPVEENSEQQVVEAMGEVMAKQLDIEGILAIANNSEPLEVEQKRGVVAEKTKVRIAVAHDDAFSFYYAESLKELEQLGAEIIEFSPLSDKVVPESDGMIFGGGFPEMFASRLSTNKSMVESVAQAAAKGMPIFAECGGFMYLSQALVDFAGNRYPMTGILPGVVQMNKKLQMVGYVEAELLADSILGAKGTKFRGHEFHFSSEQEENSVDVNVERAFCFVRARNGACHLGGFIKGNVLGSYLHLHFAGYPKAAECFVNSCLNFRDKSEIRG